MSKYLRADGGLRGKTGQQQWRPGREIIAVASLSQLSPALIDIQGAIDYLGKPSRSKFYADLLPQLTVVRFGGRTFIEVASLDALIAANRREPAV